MKRSFLEELGIEKETIDKIMVENGKDIEKAKGSLTDVQKERDELKDQIKDHEKQLEDLKKATGNAEELQKQIEQLQADNKQIKVNSAIEKALTVAKAKNIKAVKALLDLENAELSEDGTIKGLDEQIKLIQKENDFLFESEKKENGFKPKGMKPTEPNDDKPTGISKEDFAKMSYKERVDLYNTDKDTYNALAGNTENEE